MSKRATEKSYEAYPLNDTNNLDTNARRVGFKQGYELAEKDIIAIIESRIAEILGDAQPKPIIRIELEELITRINEAKK